MFPYGYGQQACKIAGMRVPLKLWLYLELTRGSSGMIWQVLHDKS